MDIEKLINQMRFYGSELGATPLNNIIGKYMLQAATALSTLQIENQALRNAANGFKAENEKLRADLARVTAERDAAVEELETYMIQDVVDGNEPCGICAKASATPCECCDPKWRGIEKED